MKIETKYNIGDELYFINASGEPGKIVVKKIKIETIQKEEVNVITTYTMAGDGVSFEYIDHGNGISPTTRFQIYESKEEVLKIFSDKLKNI